MTDLSYLSLENMYKTEPVNDESTLTNLSLDNMYKDKIIEKEVQESIKTIQTVAGKEPELTAMAREFDDSTPYAGEAGKVAKAAGMGLVHGTLTTAESVGTMLQYHGGKIGEGPQRYADLTLTQRAEFEGKIANMIASGAPKHIAEKSAWDAMQRQWNENHSGFAEFVENQGEIVSAHWGEQANSWELDDFKGKNVWDNPELLKSPTWWVYNVADMAPSLAAAIIPGAGAYKGLKVAGALTKMNPAQVAQLAKLGAALTSGSVGGALEASGTYKAVLANGGSKKEAQAASELMFFASAALNSLSMNTMLSKAGQGFLKKAANRGLSGAVESVTEGLEEPAQVMAKITSKVLNGEELPDNIAELYIESLKDGLTVAPIAAVTGVAGGGATSNLRKSADNSGIFQDEVEKLTQEVKAIQSEHKKQDILRSQQMTEEELTASMASEEVRLLRILDQQVEKEREVIFLEGDIEGRKRLVNQFTDMTDVVQPDVDQALREHIAGLEEAKARLDPSAFEDHKDFNRAYDNIHQEIYKAQDMLALSDKLYGSRQFQKLGVFDIRPSDVVRQNGKPYAKAGTALTAAKRQGVEGTHYIVPVRDGYALREIPDEIQVGFKTRLRAPANTEAAKNDGLVLHAIINELSNENSPIRFLYDNVRNFDYTIVFGDPGAMSNTEAGDLGGNLGVHNGPNRRIGLNVKSNRDSYKSLAERQDKAVNTLIHELIHAQVYTNLHIRGRLHDPTIANMVDVARQKYRDKNDNLDYGKWLRSPEKKAIDASVQAAHDKTIAWYESVRDIWESIPQEEIDKIMNKPWERRTDKEKFISYRIEQIHGYYKDSDRTKGPDIDVPEGDLAQRAESIAYHFQVRHFEEVITSLSSRYFNEWLRTIPYKAPVTEEGRNAHTRKTLWTRLIDAVMGAVNMNNDVPKTVLDAIERNLNTHIYTEDISIPMSNTQRDTLSRLRKDAAEKAPLMVQPRNEGVNPKHIQMSHTVSAELNVPIRAEGSMDGLSYFTILPDKKRGPHADTLAILDGEVSVRTIKERTQAKLTMRKDLGETASQIVSEIEVERDAWLASGGKYLKNLNPLYWMRRWLDPATAAYQRIIGDRAWKAMSETGPEWVASKGKVFDWMFTGLFEDFAKPEEYLNWRREHEIQMHRWNVVADSLKKQLDALTPAEQLRAAQIAQGSITMKNKKYRAAIKAMKRFQRLETKLHNLGLLGDHQFRALTRKELAKTKNHIDQITTALEAIEKDIRTPGTQGRIQGSYMANLNASLGTNFKTVKNMIDNRTDLLVRMQIHYKNSGKEYLSALYKRLENSESLAKRYDDMKRFNDMRVNRKWAIRRDNWDVKVNDDGSVRIYKKTEGNKKLLSVGERVVRGINREIHDAAVFQFFNKIAINEDMSGGAWVTEGRQLPKSDSLGPLSQAYVNPHIYHDLMDYHREVTTTTRYYKKFYTKWKAGKTIWNPATQARNLLSNMILADLTADIQLWQDPINMLTSMAGAWKIISGGETARDTYLNEVKFDTMLIGTDFTSAEINALGDIWDSEWLQEKVKELKDSDKTMSSTVSWMLDFFDKAMHGKQLVSARTPAKIFQMIESGMKIAVYKKLREEGMSVEEAERVATKALFDYNKVPRAIQMARYWYSPFITFAFKATPRIAEAAVRKPWKMGKYFAALWGAQMLSNMIAGDDPEEIEEERRYLPEHMADIIPGMHSHLRMSWKDEAGRSRYLDFSYILPWGDFTEQWGQANIALRIVMPNHPLFNILANLKSNENIFLHQELTASYDTDGEVLQKMIWHGIEELSPNNPLMNPYRWNKLMASIYGDKDWRGRDYSFGYALFDMALGLKFRAIDPTEEHMWRSRDMKEKIKDLRNDFSKKMKKTMNSGRNQEWKEKQDTKNWEWLYKHMDAIQDEVYWLQTGEKREDE